jgi:TIR domain
MKTDQEEAQVPEPARGHDVFVSYSRADRDAVVRLTEGLASKGKRAWVDLEDIPPSAEWMAEIRSAIDAADGYLVAISPDVARSKVCSAELEHARLAGKRIVPVLVRPTDPESVPQTLAALNWVDATDGSLEGAVDRIVEALDTDLDHVKAHTRLLVRASEWDGRSQPRSLLLRGEDLKDAEALLVAAQGKEPAPTPVQARFVQASRQGASRRQRSAVAIALCVALLAAGLGVFAWQQRGEAIDQRGVAEEQRQLAEEQAATSKSRELASASTSQLDIDPELGLLLAIEAAEAATTPEAESALREALLSSNHVATLVGHENPVLGASFSPDGDRVLTTSYWAQGYVPQGDTGDVSTRIWDVASGDAIASIDVDRSSRPHSEFAPEGDVVLSSRDMTPFVADASTGATIRIYRELGQGVAHFDPSGAVVVGTCAQGACLVEASTGELVRTLRSSSGPVREAVYTPDGASILAITSRNGWIWNAASGRLVHRLEIPWVASGSPSAAMARG